MANYALELQANSDSQLAELLGSPDPGSPKHEQIKFELQRRAMAAQTRAAVAAEKYTRLTFLFILVTAIGSIINALATWLK